MSTIIINRRIYRILRYISTYNVMCTHTCACNLTVLLLSNTEGMRHLMLLLADDDTHARDAHPRHRITPTSTHTPALEVYPDEYTCHKRVGTRISY